MKEALDGFAIQLMEAKKLGRDIHLAGHFNRVVVCGMGGSGVPGDLLKAYASDMDVDVVKNYFIPRSVDKRTLMFLVSYSGNTEETLSCFRQGLRVGCQMVGISSGGKLQELCRQYRVPHVDVPKGYQPRIAYPLQLFPILNVLENLGLVSSAPDIDEAVDLVKNADFTGHARQLAALLVGKLPIIYSSERMFGVANRWRIAFLENCKIFAAVGVFPEIDHNELLAYANPRLPFHVMILHDEDDYRRIKDRMKLTKKLISRTAHVTEIRLSGKGRLAKIVSSIFLGDLISFYLAESMGVDPTDISLVEDFKKQLGSGYLSL